MALTVLFFREAMEGIGQSTAEKLVREKGTKGFHYQYAAGVICA